MARLTPDQVAAARSDPALAPRARNRPKNGKRQRPKNEAERIVAAALDEMGIAWEYEDTFFPTPPLENGKEQGFCPDFRILATDDWPEQYLEVTMMDRRGLCKKHQKIANAEGIYGIVVTLLDYRAVPLIQARHASILDYLVVRVPLKVPA